MIRKRSRFLFSLLVLLILSVSCKQASRVSDAEQLKIQLNAILTASHESVEVDGKTSDYLKAMLETQSGDVKMFNPEKELYVFFTRKEEKTSMLIINTSPEQIELDATPFREYIKSYEMGVDIATRHPHDVKYPIPVEGKSVLVLELGHWL